VLVAVGVPSARPHGKDHVNYGQGSGDGGAVVMAAYTNP
jgi:hypothetical protein